MKSKDGGKGDKTGKKKYPVSLEPKDVLVNSEDKEFLEAFLDFIERELSKEKVGLITNKRLCDKFLLSTSSLNRKVKKLTGESPKHFIQSFCLKRAKQLLKNKAGNISKVAEMVGFSEASSFSRAFTREFGESPTKFLSAQSKKTTGKAKGKKLLDKPEEKGIKKRMVLQVELTVDNLDREHISRISATRSAHIFDFNDSEGTPLRDEIMKKAEAVYDPPIPLASNQALKDFSLQEIVKKMRLKMDRMRKDIRDANKPGGYTDKRLDFFVINNFQVKRNALSVAAVCLKEDLLPSGSGDYELRTKIYGKTFNLCATEPFYRQPIAAGLMRTGVLVGDDIVATTANVIDKKNVSDLCFVFGFAIRKDGKPVNQIPGENMYQAVEIVHSHYKSGEEWILVKLDRKVTGREIAVLSKEKIQNGGPAYVIGHPCGLPLKYAPGTSIKDVNESHFSADLDVYGGSIGSPVFCAGTHELIGMVIRAHTQDFRWNGTHWFTLRYQKSDPDYKRVQIVKSSAFDRSLLK